MNSAMNTRSIVRLPHSSQAATLRRRLTLSHHRHHHAPRPSIGLIPTRATSQLQPSSAVFGEPPQIATHNFPSLYRSRFYRSLVSIDKRWFSDRKAEESSSPETPTSSTEEEASTTEAKDESTSAAGEESPTSSKQEQHEVEIRSLKDQLLRSLADQDNTRRIAQRDIESARQFAIKSFAKSLLEVSDNLSRALEAVPKDEVEKAKGTTLATLYEGIEMTERGLNKAFEMNGLHKYGAEGEPFDPNQHEALFEYPDPSKPAGTVGQVMKVGFMLNKRVLRPAEVGVVKNPE